MPAYTQLIKNWPLPKTRTALRAFLGKVCYSAKKAAPLLGQTSSPCCMNTRARLQISAACSSQRRQLYKDRKLAIPAHLQVKVAKKAYKLMGHKGPEAIQHCQQCATL